MDIIWKFLIIYVIVVLKLKGVILASIKLTVYIVKHIIFYNKKIIYVMPALRLKVVMPVYLILLVQYVLEVIFLIIINYVQR